MISRRWMMREKENMIAPHDPMRGRHPHGGRHQEGKQQVYIDHRRSAMTMGRK